MLLNRIGIVVKPNKEEALSVARELTSWLAKKKVRVYLDSIVAPSIHPSLSCPREEIGRWVDLLIVLGGDGTLLSAARHLEGEKVPILGVNLGALGFLTETTLEELYPVLERALEGNMETEGRMKLHVTVLRRGDKVGEYAVLNDVVISKSVLARIINLRNSINGAYVTTYRGDGVIISTPTGSTAYSLAAGGPILPPTLQNFVLVPIAPHLSLDRPVVLSQGSTVEIVVHTDHQAILTTDGQNETVLKDGDRVIVKASQHVALFARVQPPSYFYRTLMSRLKGEGCD